MTKSIDISACLRLNSYADQLTFAPRSRRAFWALSIPKMNNYLKNLKGNFQRVPRFVYGLSGFWAVAFSFGSNYLYYFSKNLHPDARSSLFFNILASIFVIEIVIIASLRLPFSQNMRFSTQIFTGAFLGFCLVFQGYVIYLLFSL